MTCFRRHGPCLPTQSTRVGLLSAALRDGLTRRQFVARYCCRSAGVYVSKIHIGDPARPTDRLCRRRERKISPNETLVKGADRQEALAAGDRLQRSTTSRRSLTSQSTCSAPLTPCAHSPWRSISGLPIYLALPA